MPSEPTATQGPETAAAWSAVVFEPQTMPDGTVIEVAAPEGAFPAGVRLSVQPVEAKTVLAAIREAAGGTDIQAGQVAAYDFQFSTGDGAGVEPLRP